jgi:GTP-binding protein
MPSFIDEAIIDIAAGNGGDGVVSFRHEKYIPKGGPDGGDGGKGGSIYFQADANYNTLYHLRYKKKFAAPVGERGSKSNQHGKSGQDITIKVPVGTIIAGHISGAEQRIDLHTDGQTVLIAKGGNGGKGNARFANSTQQRPTKSTPGKPGEALVASLELKLLADIGLVGLPNAGKSTLLADLTTANPKIGSYPFTTLEPNLGVAHYYDREVVIADIPGLIDGASTGKGLGDQFLRHIERTKLLFHVLSLDPNEGDMWQRYVVIEKELSSFNIELSQKSTMVLLTKVDLVDTQTVEQAIKLFSRKGIRVIERDILSEENALEILKQALAIIDTEKQNAPKEEIAEIVPTYTLQTLPQRFAKRPRA